jgi:glyoxylase-like metal-dependent hydrolase (beta-lactamase superfamily II)
VQVGRFGFEVRHVPGHAPGHVAFVGHGLCLSGDVVFEDSIGRTDLAGGSLPVLMDSIRREVLTLPDATRILPGHGPETTVGRERLHNPFLQAG